MKVWVLVKTGKSAAKLVDKVQDVPLLRKAGLCHSFWIFILNHSALPLEISHGEETCVLKEESAVDCSESKHAST